jgi:chorismate-pyruvate lyase
MADPPEVVARAVKSEMVWPEPAIRALLQTGEHEDLRYRRVHLMCGDELLSVADNWYVPSRLSGEMNRTLETTDLPFGKVVAPLNYHRKQLSSDRGRAEGCPEGTVLRVRAVLVLPDGRPISAVAECYTAANLAPPRR